ncbi:MAG TPA: hypothetical protein VFW40_13030 [Capsulimonadaceae bacterium]|nr:hypothetical protein [Capsulimonadaceae bacterium]
MNKQGIGLWIVVCALLILDIGINCVRAQDNAAKITKTQELQILNPDGNTMIDMKVSDKGYPVVAMRDKDGNNRLGLLVLSDGGHAGMLDAAGKPMLEIDGSDVPGVNIYKNGKPVAEFANISGSEPTLAMQDNAGNDRVYLAYRPSIDSAMLHLSDKTGKQIAEMAQSPDYSILDVTDKTATRRVALRCTSDNVPGIFVADKDGNPVWSKVGSDSQ